MRAAMIIFLSLVAATPSAFAQSDPPRGRISGIIGTGKTWDDEGSLGTGVVAGGRVEWRLFGNTGIEGAFEGLTHDRSGGFFESEGASAMLSVSLLHRFGPDKYQTYILEGVDLIHHSGTTRFNNLAFDRESTDGGFHLGVGFAVRVGERVEIGPEGRFYVLRAENGSDPAWANWIGMRVGWRINP